MNLTLNSRFAANIYIIHLNGSIVLGPESKALETALDEGITHGFNRFVLSLAEVHRLDSIGIGLLVRFAERLRRRGGDIRLAESQPFLTKLLELTQLSKILHTYPTEEEAILSFLNQPSPEDEKQKSGPHVLFVDESADLCVFVRTILGQYGFDVDSACLLRDAKMLLRVDGADILLIGPGTYQRPADTVMSALTPLAPKAAAHRLADDFKSLDAGAATDELLRIFKLEHRAETPPAEA